MTNSYGVKPDQLATGLVTGACIVLGIAGWLVGLVVEALG